MPRNTSTASWRSASPPPHSSGGRAAASVTAVVAAAGSGERLGAGGPKAFVPLAGRPMVEWSLAALREAVGVRSVVVACPPGQARELAGGDLTVVEGGATRARSVAGALEVVGTELVAIHDAARPLVTAELVEGTVAALVADESAAGAIAAVPITDTVKRERAAPGADPGTDPEICGTFYTREMSNRPRIVEETLDRGRLWAAQTPQVFRVEALREALAADPAALDSATDEAGIVERAGGRVLIHPSSPENLKVTTPLDLRLAELLLAADGNRA